jgi:hypothetical protein
VNFRIKVSLLFGAFLCLLFLTSCDPWIELNVEVRNNTNSKLIVEYKYYYETDTSVVLDLGEHIQIYRERLRMKASEFKCCPCTLDSINIFTVDTLKYSMKDPTNSKNWIKVSDDRIDCVLLINEVDLE